MARHSNPTPRASGFGIFWTNPKNGRVIPCEAYTVDAEGNTTSGDYSGEKDAEAVAGAYERGETFLTYEGYSSKKAADRAQIHGDAYSVRPLPVGTLFYIGETLCVVAAPASDPADYARNHWRKFESPEDHALRVEAAEREAGRYFASATMQQLDTFNKSMAFLRPFRGPTWDRRRAYAQAVWNETTAGARELFEITADEIMRDGEISEATALAWDVLDEMAAQASQPLPLPTVVTHPQPQAGL